MTPYLYQSNQLQALLPPIMALIQRHSHPITPLTVLVPSQGMARWLTLQCADWLGVCGNVNFELPSRWLWQKLIAQDAQHHSHHSADNPLDWSERHALVWHIMAQLNSHSAHRVAPSPSRLNSHDLNPHDLPALLHDYLAIEAEEGQPSTLLSVAQRLADLFDQYQTYRPHWLAAWAQGATSPDDLATLLHSALHPSLSNEHRLELMQHAQWQAKLWYAVSYQQRSRADVLNAALTTITTETRNIQPKRSASSTDPLIVFQIGIVPTTLRHYLHHQATHRPVHIFLLNPSQVLWDNARRTQLSQSQTSNTNTQDTLLDAPFHPLLATLGSYARDQLTQWLTEDSGQSLDFFTTSPRDRASTSLLHALQTDILQNEIQPYQVIDTHQTVPDQSLSFHLAHTPLQEVLIVHQLIRERLGQSTTTQIDTTQDILILVPNLTRYAPMIDLVFGGMLNTPQAIPYHIADLSWQRHLTLFRVLQQLLTLPTSDYRTSRVMQLLDHAVIRHAADISAEERQIVQHWVEAAHIQGGTHHEPHSWHTGLQRLRVSIMLPNVARQQGICIADETTRQPLSPVTELHGGHRADLLYRFTRWINYLLRLADEVRQPRSLSDWCTWLLQHIAPDQIATNLTDTNLNDSNLTNSASAQPWWQLEPTSATHATHSDSDAAIDPQAMANQRHALQLILRSLNKLRQQAAHPTVATLKVSYTDAVTVFQQQLEQHIQQQGSGFISPKVTICDPQALRGIPFKHIYMMGMNAEDVYHHDTPAHYDLMPHTPMIGDRNRRGDQRLMLLETLLAAQNSLTFSWLGWHSHNSEATTTLTEIEHIYHVLQRMGVTPTVHHYPRHAPNLDGFLSTIRNTTGNTVPDTLHHTSTTNPAATDTPVSVSPPQPQSILTLLDAYKTPIQSALRQHQIRWHDGRTASNNPDPLSLSPLARWQITHDTIQRELAIINAHSSEELSQTQAYQAIVGKGHLPAGALGEWLYDEQLHSHTALAHTLQQQKLRPQIHSMAIDAPNSGKRLYFAQNWLATVGDYAGHLVTWTTKSLTPQRLASRLVWRLHQAAVVLSAPDLEESPPIACFDSDKHLRRPIVLAGISRDNAHLLINRLLNPQFNIHGSQEGIELAPIAWNAEDYIPATSLDTSFGTTAYYDKLQQDHNDIHRGHHSNGFIDPEALLRWLLTRTPNETLDNTLTLQRETLLQQLSEPLE
jgi:exonuclease V gamma subunit